CRE
ncbi:Oligopeptide ABC transporter2C periplasmic oligopeptide-binding protein OppA (TC 3.A.1.5.1), partial [Terribacillus sp. AE2B 122]